MDDLLTEFLTECFESMTVLDAELVRLEREPDDPELIASIFRLVHTIKGTCGFLDLSRLETVAHAAENVLGKLRDREMAATPAVVTLVLKALDRIKDILDALANDPVEPAGDDSELIAALDAIADLEPTKAVNGGSEALDAIPADLPSELVPHASADRPEPRPAEAAPPEPASPVVASAKAVAGRTEEAGRGARAESLAAQTLRVPVDLLEQLMTLVGELVLTRNQLLQTVRHNTDQALKSPLQRLNQITGELQEGVMRTRMQAIGTAWSKLPRLIRDLALELDKEIELEMRGAETELDRQVLEMIKDPLTHMVRNAADHGLERPYERERAGKPVTGTIGLNAFHEGGHIIIEISDDGKGLDTRRIAEKAVARGLVTEADAAGMADEDLQQFIFHPGFSTAETVTAVSGRGVGMDVVRTNIEKIGGSIEIRSRLGQGSVFTIKIPLTLAIVSALILEAGGERFALPQIGVVELVRTGGTSEHRVEMLDGVRVLRLRDRLLPLASLAGVLGLPAGDTSGRDGSYVVLVRVGSRVFGLEVDKLFDTEEIVVKPVAPILRSVSAFSGNTILGDGSVVMILDLNGLATMLDASRGEGERRAAVEEAVAEQERVSLLLFKAGGGQQMAVPLALVTRLEEIAGEAIERAADRSVVLYRDALMPLAEITGEPARREAGNRPVLVFTDCERNMGLVVDQIVDVVEADVRMELKGCGGSELGTAVIAGRPTQLLDVAFFVNRTFGGWFSAEETEAFGDDRRSPLKVLIVDDSRFVRSMLQPILEAEGMAVTTADSADRALRLREEGRQFDLIISDIEMPGTNGFAFVENCRAGGPWQRTRIVALTSHSTPSDVERGRLAGFDGHVGKLDREALIATLASAKPMLEAA
jgi:two-component system chemotaxis sensor kinase CheA